MRTQSPCCVQNWSGLFCSFPPEHVKYKILENISSLVKKKYK